MNFDFMKQFFLIYLLLNLYIFSLTHIVNDGQTTLTLWILEFFLKPGQLQKGDIIINAEYKLIVTQACNGMLPIIFIVAAILAYPSKISHKIIWIFLAYLLFTVVNVLRILMVVYFVEKENEQKNFYIAHDILGNTLLLLLGAGIYFVFVRYQTLESKSKKLN